MKLLVLDTETGGVDPNRYSLLEVALAILEPFKGTVITAKGWMIKHREYVVDPQALEVNRLSLISLYHHGLPPEQVIEEIRTMVKLNFEDKPIVVGHNVNFDIAFVDQLFNQHGQSFKDLISHRVLDTASIIRFLQFAGQVPMDVSGLEGALRYFKVCDEQTHRALYDCIDTATLLYKLIEFRRGFIDD